MRLIGQSYGHHMVLMWKITILLILSAPIIYGQELIHIEAKLEGLCDQSRGGCACRGTVTSSDDVVGRPSNEDITVICAPRASSCACSCVGARSGTIYDSGTCPYTCRAARDTANIRVGSGATMPCFTNVAGTPAPTPSSTPSSPPGSQDKPTSGSDGPVPAPPPPSPLPSSESGSVQVCTWWIYWLLTLAVNM